VQAGHHEYVWVFEVLARRGVKLVEFVLVGEGHLDYLWAHATYEVSADRPARVPSRIHPCSDFHGYVLEPRLAIELSQPAAEVRVGAVAGERDREDLAQSIERGMWRLADRGLGVRLKAGHPPTLPGASAGPSPRAPLSAGAR
jgi:hypothetical protein